MRIDFHSPPGWRLLGSTLPRPRLMCWTRSTLLKVPIWRLGGNKCFQSVPSWFKARKEEFSYTMSFTHIDSITRWTKRILLEHRSTGGPKGGFPMRQGLKISKSLWCLFILNLLLLVGSYPLSYIPIILYHIIILFVLYYDVNYIIQWSNCKYNSFPFPTTLLCCQVDQAIKRISINSSVLLMWRRRDPRFE